MMDRDKNMLLQDIHGNMLADGCQLSPVQYQKYAMYKESRFINVYDAHDYFYRDVNDNKTLMKTDKPLPILYHQKDECCGCGACFSICPRIDKVNTVRKNPDGKVVEFQYQLTKNGKIVSFPHTGAITMLPDEDGFLYPVVDAEVCIRCYKCLSVCDFKAE